MKLNRQVFNIFIVVIGAGMLIYNMAMESENIYVKIIGLVLLMYGLYTSTQQWVTDNKEEKDDTKFDQDAEDHK